MGCAVSSCAKLVGRLLGPVLLPKLYLGVPIGTKDTVLSYIDPTWGPHTFCMWTACKRRCRAYPAKIRSVSANVFRQSHKAY